MTSWGGFEGEVAVVLEPDGRTVKVEHSFAYMRPNGQKITVEAGLTCDGASIPRILWPLAGGPFEGKHRAAAIVHDYLYSLGRAGTPLMTRAEADRCFYEAQRCCGVSAFSARSKYLAVRAFGPRW